MAKPDMNDAIGVVRRLQHALAHKLMGETDPNLPIKEALAQVNADKDIQAANKFVDEAVWGAA